METTVTYVATIKLTEDQYALLLSMAHKRGVVTADIIQESVKNTLNNEADNRYREMLQRRQDEVNKNKMSND